MLHFNNWTERGDRTVCGCPFSHAGIKPYAEKSIIRFAKRCGMEAERVKSTHIDINRYDGLIVTMMSHIHKTAIVEGIRHRSLPIIAVQWHPENSGKGTKIGKEFKKMCLAYRHINSR